MFTLFVIAWCSYHVFRVYVDLRHLDSLDMTGFYHSEITKLRTASEISLKAWSKVCDEYERLEKQNEKLRSSQLTIKIPEYKNGKRKSK